MQKTKTKALIKTDSQLIKLRMRQPHLKTDYSVFKKSNFEKNILKHLKKLHHSKLRSAGLNPRKVMNLPNLKWVA